MSYNHFDDQFDDLQDTITTNYLTNNHDDPYSDYTIEQAGPRAGAGDEEFPSYETGKNNQSIDFSQEYHLVAVDRAQSQQTEQYIADGIASFSLSNVGFNQEDCQLAYEQHEYHSSPCSQPSVYQQPLIEPSHLQDVPIYPVEQARQFGHRRLNSSGNIAEGNSSSSSSSFGDNTPNGSAHRNHRSPYTTLEDNFYQVNSMRNTQDESKWPQALDQGSSRPYVEIVEQPAKCALRFRYKCEGRSAGSLPGVNSNGDNKTYPAIKIHNYVGKAVVVISCVSKDAPYRTHPHNIVGKEGCKRGICTIVINNEPEMVRSFPSLGIQCVKRKDIAESLTTRESIKVDPFRLGFNHKLQGSDIDLNAVRLCFQVFITSTHPQKCDVPLIPVVSDPIHDKKAMSDLVITKLSHHAAPATGGREVIILCDRVPKDDIQIKFYEERGNEVVWETFVDVAPTDVHKQVAISFRTPKYRDEHITQNVMARIQLRRISDNALSEPRIFQFLHCESDEDILSRKRRKIQQFNLNHSALENILTVNSHHAQHHHAHHHPNMLQPQQQQQQQQQHIQQHPQHNQLDQFQQLQQQQPMPVQFPIRINNPQIHHQQPMQQSPQQTFTPNPLQQNAQICMMMQQVPQINNHAIDVQIQDQNQITGLQQQHPQPQPRRSTTSSPQSQRVSPIPMPQAQLQQLQTIQVQNQQPIASSHQTLNTLTVPNTNNINQNCDRSISRDHSPSPSVHQMADCQLTHQQNGYTIESQNLVVRGQLIDKDGKIMQLVARPEAENEQQQQPQGQEQIDADHNQNIRPLDSSLDRIRISELMPDMTFNTNLEY